MAKADLSERIAEQLAPIFETLQRRIESDLTDRDKAAVAYAIVDAATVGARVAYGAILANAAEAGIALPPGLNLEGLHSQDLWPDED